MSKLVHKLPEREKPGSRVAELKQNPNRVAIAKIRSPSGKFVVSRDVYLKLRSAGSVLDLGGTNGPGIRLGSLETDAARLHGDLTRVGDDFRTVIARELKRHSAKK